MNEYGFDYMNYITSIPNNMNYNPKIAMNYPSQKQETQNIVSNQQAMDVTSGWIRGNLFPNLYIPYKNYKPVDLNPTTEKDAMLYQVMQYKFALIELDLYLDTHPNDTNAIGLYNQYLNIEKQLSNKYESMYGPLTLESNYLAKNNWVWKNSPWPWEGV
jgi:spore coat protein JB